MVHVPAVRNRRGAARRTSYPRYADEYEPRHHDRPSSSRSSLILLIAGMGIGYLILPVLLVQNGQVGLEEVVQRLEERQRANSQAFHYTASGTAMNTFAEPPVRY